MQFSVYRKVASKKKYFLIYQWIIAAAVKGRSA